MALTLPALKPRAPRADLRRMNRSIGGLPLLLVALVIGGILFALQMRSQGPTSQPVQQAETQAVQAVASTNFGAADEMMRAYYLQSGTYVGATLDASYGVTVVRADATSYCLQGGAGTTLEHELGPNGAAAPGPC
jgi:hypothetical protein